VSQAARRHTGGQREYIFRERTPAEDLTREHRERLDRWFTRYLLERRRNTDPLVAMLQEIVEKEQSCRVGAGRGNRRRLPPES